MSTALKATMIQAKLKFYCKNIEILPFEINESTVSQQKDVKKQDTTLYM